MLFSIVPFTEVLAAIGPVKGALAVTLVFEELSLVFLAVFPSEYAFALHFVLVPIANILFTFGPVEFTESMNLVL